MLPEEELRVFRDRYQGGTTKPTKAEVARIKELVPVIRGRAATLRAQADDLDALSEGKHTAAEKAVAEAQASAGAAAETPKKKGRSKPVVEDDDEEEEE